MGRRRLLLHCRGNRAGDFIDLVDHCVDEEHIGSRDRPAEMPSHRILRLLDPHRLNVCELVDSVHAQLPSMT
jgi:hypothetical protein